MALRVRAWVLSLVLALLFAALSAPARAEHEPSHRYFVVGTVRNDLGERLCGMTVRAANIDAPAPDSNRTAVTDGAGRYVIQLHLHDAVVGPENSNVGDTILVAVEGTNVRTTTTAVPNGNNPEGWGQQTVDLMVPGGKGTCPPLLLYAGAAGGVAVAAIAVWGLTRRPRRGRTGLDREILALPGMNRTRARELARSGVKTLKDLAASDPVELAGKTNLTPKEARLLVKRAKEQG